ncbi:MAG: folylpolyglutamate synthase/dihydrofolate synthase family protein [Thermodesulfovibrio sp.]|nr:folylpolyglutamate synthase/dihydrofolate synthase family protein [Thermodesulfovibrio sp.]
MYEVLINELYKRRTKGIKLGLERVFSVLEKFYNPHRGFKSVHIAGTNGKGSTSKIIYHLLRAHGLNTGLFTSPHLTRFTERIIVNDREITEDEVVRLIEKIKPFGEELTFFEFITVLAFLYFAEAGIEYAVLETGMGGRLDATNVVVPEVSVITTIGLDHQEFLGNNIRSIAQEKAGIIKKGVPVVSSKQASEAEEVIRKKAEESGSELFIYGKDFSAELKSMSIKGINFIFSSASSLQTSALFLPLIGLHQLENVAVAMQSFMTIYPNWDENYIREGLKNVTIPGRLEIISEKPLIIFDIAHNPQAAQTLIKSLQIITDKKPVLLFGIMRDKDVSGFLKSFENYANKIIFTVPNYERALKYDELSERLNGYSLNLSYISDPVEAFKEGFSICKKNPNLYLLCTGSVYLVGELKEFLGEKTSHRRLGEVL